MASIIQLRERMLLCDLGGAQSPTAVNFTVSFNASGIFTVTIT